MLLLTMEMKLNEGCLLRNNYFKDISLFLIVDFIKSVVELRFSFYIICDLWDSTVLTHINNLSTIYLVDASKSDPTVAPAGCSGLKILPHIPYINDKNPLTREDYIKLKDSVIDKLERMGLTDLRKHIVYEHLLTPLDVEAMYYSNKGSVYGIVSDLKKNFAFKLPKKSKKYKNLYFVGSSVNPGGGMPMVLLSGQNTCKKILEDDK